MRYPAYPQYKESGVAWLGEVPAHWEVRRLRHLLVGSFQYGANEAAELNDPDLPRYVRITDVDGNGNLRDETFRSLPKDIAAPYLLTDGDLLFARSGATSGKTFLYRSSWGVCAYAGYLIRVRMNQQAALPEFVKYFTTSTSYWQWLSSICIQSTIQNVSAEKYADLKMPLAPLSEQYAILNFLDVQTAKIDTLLTKKRELIDRLKEKRSALISRTVTQGLPPEAAHAAGFDPQPTMKPSGIEWLGRVLENWKVVPLKWKASCSSGDGISFEDVIPEATGGFNIPTIGGNGLMGYTNRPNISGAVLVIGRVGALCGNVHRVSPPAWVTDNALILLVDTCTFDRNFMFYALITRNMNEIASRTAQPLITGTQVRDQQIPCPPLQEQQTIAAFLDRETAKIDQLVAKVQEAIDRLQEYRTALITAAVTGKIDVRQHLAQEAP